MPPLRRALVLVVPVVTLVALGGLAAVWSVSRGADEAAPERTPPRIRVPTQVRSTVGEPVVIEAVAHDAEGDEVPVTLERAAVGVEGTRDSLRWTPDDAGTATVTLAARDGEGLVTTRTVELVARYPARPDLLVSLGDSVASGHGLQRRDYLGADDCWRDEGDAYPRRVLDGLVDAGRVGDDAALALVACSGAAADDLATAPVTGGPEEIGDTRSQLEWAVRANPGHVTLTVGANDLDFHRPGELVDGDGLDVAGLDGRLDDLEAALRPTLERLRDATDATVVVTTYHDPVADEPRGIEGCRDVCFHDAVGEAADRLNARLAEVVDDLGSDRVVVAEVAERFEGHGAASPAGGFTLRDTAVDVLGAVAPVPEITTNAYCAAGDGDGGGSWISGVDCVHPDDRGAQAYADAVIEAIG